MTEAICPWLSSLPRYYSVRVFIVTKVKEITEASASVGLLLATAVTQCSWVLQKSLREKFANLCSAHCHFGAIISIKINSAPKGASYSLHNWKIIKWTILILPHSQKNGS